MIETPQVIQTGLKVIAFVPLCVTWNEMRVTMGPGLTELREAIAAQGIAATGPWFTHHLRRPTDTLDCEICLPVAAAVRPVGRVRTGTLPGGAVARTVHHGDYAGLGAAWSEFAAWIAANGHQTRPDFWECYVTGPPASLNPADWRTALNWPLIEANGGTEIMAPH